MSTIDVNDVFEILRSASEMLDCDLDEISVTAATSLEYDLQMDSLNLMDFLVLLEKKYQVTISDDKLGDVASIGDVVALLNELQVPAAASAC